MREVLNDLVSDVGRAFSISVVGDIAFLRTLSDNQILVLMDALCTNLLASVERRNKIPLETLEALTDRQNGSAKNFLASLSRLVFGSDGRELTLPDRSAFAALYQVYSLLTKFGSGDVTSAMTEHARSSYLRIEDEICPPCISDSIADTARKLIAKTLSYADAYPLRGRHGPGAVAEGSLPSGKKYLWNLPPGFPGDAYSFLSDYVSLGTSLEKDPVRVLRDPWESKWCTVPKSWNKCRAICAEPALLQYCQQAVGRAVAYACRVSPFCGADVYRQDTNADLAIQSSGHGYYCTLDLSAASDRLSYKLVEALFPESWFALLVGCRSKRTRMPDGSSLELRKYGSMGNATTFPVQSLIYWALLTALLVELKAGTTSECASNVYAYGDDIILPSTYARDAIALLTDVGLKVNESKSFVNGSFRESCGAHAYHGVSCKPTYLRTTSRTGPGLVSMCACANSLLRAGWKTPAERLFKYIEDTVEMRLPVVGESYWADERSVQLARIEPLYSFSMLVTENIARGIRVRRDGCQRLSVKALGLYETKTKRRANVFANTADMWDYIHGRTADEDRGYIPGDVALYMRYIRLQ